MAMTASMCNQRSSNKYDKLKNIYVTYSCSNNSTHYPKQNIFLSFMGEREIFIFKQLHYNKRNFEATFECYKFSDKKNSYAKIKNDVQVWGRWISRSTGRMVDAMRIEGFPHMKSIPTSYMKRQFS